VLQAQGNWLPRQPTRASTGNGESPLKRQRADDAAPPAAEEAAAAAPAEEAAAEASPEDAA
jgi:hypothetical protein